jgi:hypothetical protein
VAGGYCGGALGGYCGALGGYCGGALGGYCDVLGGFCGALGDATQLSPIGVAPGGHDCGSPTHAWRDADHT